MDFKRLLLLLLLNPFFQSQLTGYRHIPLRNELYQPLLMPSVFVHIKVKDYVPVGLANFADALVNPIQHQLKMDEQVKIRTEALSILLEEAKLMEESKEAAAEDIPDDTANTSTPVGHIQEWIQYYYDNNNDDNNNNDESDLNSTLSKGYFSLITLFPSK